LLDPSIAIAACRAGELGVLDLEYVVDEAHALRAIATLARYAQNTCGLKLDSRATAFVDRVIASLPAQVGLVILTPTAPDALRQQIQALHRHHCMVLVEATSLEEAQLGITADADGLVAKGHEAGGRVGEETTFVLLQRILANTTLPVWAQGGIALHSAAACWAAGAAGVALDVQLALTRESTLPPAAKTALARSDGSETICVGNKVYGSYRLLARPGLAAVTALRELADRLAAASAPAQDEVAAWHEAIHARVGWDSPESHVWLLGQDAAFAAPLAARFQTVSGVLAAIRAAIDEHLMRAQQLQPLAEDAPLAQAHKTRYPIVQGPMTRVSDRANFALTVAEGGALPFLALALMAAPEVEALLQETRERLGDYPWGVGILGFVPQALRQAQMEVIRAYAPPFALIAGGRPDHAQALEAAGITTYLHVPSPELLKWFISSGARHFVFEGRECGGHVGPRSSFVLWDTMIETLLEAVPAPVLAECHLLFAGGVHDALSAAMVAAMAAPLAARGTKIGVLLGTAYLFTEEAVISEAITQQFQREALQCSQTVLLESGPGHATRCVETPFAQRFEELKQQLRAAGNAPEEMRESLENLNIGRLRIAAKGVNRHPRFGEDPQVPKLIALDDEEQHQQGLYMIGQVAALRNQVCTIAELHEAISVGGAQRLRVRTELAATTSREARPADVAIVGMAALLPKAPDLRTYWENILHKVDAIIEVPPDRWDWRLYFDPDPKAPDKVYSKWGGFLDSVPFDPMRFGMPPNTLPSIEPLQLLTLNVVQQALEDAGYGARPFARERTSVILGVGGGAGDLGQQYAVRAGLPLALDDPPAQAWERLPVWTEDSFPGILSNVTAGRVANRFDLGGVNYTVDAACASALAAVYLAVRELEDGTSDMVIVGGADTVQNPFAYLCFSKTHALSPRGRCRTFDENADGIVISEGIAMLVLKRLADAERDGDRIYAVIKAVSGSSDGRDKGLTAPRPEGQIRALDRAYRKAGFSPATVGLVEAHGTGTVAGDRAEVETLKRVFGGAGLGAQQCAIGSVKSMIGHTKCTAGVAGMIKIALALHHKVLPPTLHVDKPNSILADSPFYVNTEARPWLHSVDEHPRRACVSAFGFGGTNFHGVLEEYVAPWMAFGTSSSAAEKALRALPQELPSELMLWTGADRQALLDAIAPVAQALAGGAQPRLRDVAYSLYQRAKSALAARPASPQVCLAVVATSCDDLQQKLALAMHELQQAEQGSLQHPSGVYFSTTPLAATGKIAFLFPGQGSQYPGMMRELALYFDEVCDLFDQADRVLADRLPQRLSEYILPPPHFNSAEEKAHQAALIETNVAQPALGVTSLGMLRLLRLLGVEPQMVAGHSYGEYVALCAAGVIDPATLFQLSEARGRCIIEAAHEDLGTMAAVSAHPDRVSELLQFVEGVWLANVNAPQQTVISGTRAGIDAAVALLAQAEIRARLLPVACAFHSPLVAPARDKLASVLAAVHFQPPQCPVYSNATAAPYPVDVAAIAAGLTEHLVCPVRFVDEIEAMYAAGARIFVEVGARNVMSGLAAQILGNRPHLAVALDMVGRPALLQLHHALAQLAAHGVMLQLDRLFVGREVVELDLTTLERITPSAPLPPTTWLVNGSRAWPLRGTRPLTQMAAPVAPATVSLTQRETASANMTSSGKEQTLNQVTERQTEISPAPTTSAPDTVVPNTVVPNTAAPRARGDATNGAAPSPSAAPPVITQEQVAMLAAYDGASQVMVYFQQLMAQFLATQQQVMLAYLNSTGAEASASVDIPVDIPVNSTVMGNAALPLAPAPAPFITPTMPTAVPPTRQAALDLQVSTPEAAATSNGSGHRASNGYGEPSRRENSHPDNGHHEKLIQPAAPPEQPAATWTVEQLTAQLLNLVSDRTGYPPEMLGLDMNLEADLSIDSIKRVEILGAFQRANLAGEQMPSPAAMEELTSLKTLRGIITWFAQALSGMPASHHTATSASVSAEELDTNHVPRFVVRAVES
jgi:acyl transferase domain-containing protein